MKIFEKINGKVLHSQAPIPKDILEREYLIFGCFGTKHLSKIPLSLVEYLIQIVYPLKTFLTHRMNFCKKQLF